jgi:hypothetical protein
MVRRTQSIVLGLLMATCAATSACGGPSSAGTDAGAEGADSSGAGPHDAAAAVDSSAAVDSAAAHDGSTDASSTSVDADLGGMDASSSCGSYTSGVTSCDQCIQTACCGESAQCSNPGDGGVDDAGRTRCEALLRCALECSAPPSDGGTAPSYEACWLQCKGPYSSDEQLAAMGLESCIGLSCPYDCTVQM